MRRGPLPIALLSLLVLSVLLASCEPYGDAGSMSEFRALVISNSYSNDGGNILDNTINDADDVNSAFSSLGYVSSQYENQTRSQILDRIEGYETASGQEDVLLFYFSGHGGVGTDGRSFLVPYADPGYSFIYADELLDALSEVPGKKIVILDICNSGGFLFDDGYTVDVLPDAYAQPDLLRPLAESFEKLFSAEGYRKQYEDIVVMSAAGAQEESWEGNTIQNGFFTYYLLQGLGFDHESMSIDAVIPADRDFDGIVTVDEAYGWTFDTFKTEYLQSAADFQRYYPHLSGGFTEQVLLFY